MPVSGRLNHHPDAAGAASAFSGVEVPPGRQVRQRKRREQIRRQLAADGFARTDDLASRLQVSVMTIHRDLESLERQGWLRRVRGGATAQPSSSYHGDVRHRMASAIQEKRAIAKEAEKLVHPGQAIVLDDSTTALQLASSLPSYGPITVITNFLPVVKVLAGEPGTDLVGLGGEYYPAYDAFFGRQTVQNMSVLRGDTLFMSTTAITNGRCYHLSQETLNVKLAMMAGAERRILLVDHTKFDRNAVHELGSLTEFDLVITDGGVSPDAIAMIQDTGVPLQIAPVAQEPEPPAEPAPDGCGRAGRASP